MDETAGGHELGDRGTRPARGLRASILEMMTLIVVLGVCFRWPGLSVPVGLLSLDALARRRGLLAPATLAAIRQITVALYLPPVAALLLVRFSDWDGYLEMVSPMPAFLPGALILGFYRVFDAFIMPEGTAIRITLSLASLAIAGGLVGIARLGPRRRVACVVIAIGLSVASTLVLVSTPLM